jgi:hypothetical protein
VARSARPPGDTGATDRHESLRQVTSESLEAAGVVAVLSGGAATSIYANNRYQSFDLDFVTNASISMIAKVLAPLGFVRIEDRYVRHPDT